MGKRKDPIDMSREEIRQQIIEVSARIANNDGRLTADSSADLDLAQDQLSELLAEMHLRGDEDAPKPEKPVGVIPVLFAAHNGLVNLTDETGQFVERSYIIPAEMLAEVYELLGPYQIGEDTFLDISMGGRPDGV